MRDKLDELRFKFYDITYSLKLRLGVVTDRTKYFALSFLVVSWLAVCVFMFLQTYNYKAEEHAFASVSENTTAVDTLEATQDLITIGSDAEAFELLATHRNHFAHEYTDSQIKIIERRLTALSEEANEADISVLYTTKDLVDQQPLYKFTGIVISVESDPLYGDTYTVSKDDTRTIEQLEVTGLAETTVGSQVVFFGVPRFDSVTSPIKVEAFEVPVE